MALQLAPWTTPTFSPTFYGGVMVFEPTSQRLVFFSQTPGAQPLWATSAAGPWTAGTGINANFTPFNNAVCANGVIVVAGTQATPSLSPAVSRSTDGGATWTTTLLETLLTTSGNRVAYDETFDQFVHYSSVESDTTYVRVSADDGATWGAPAEVEVPVGWDVGALLLPVGDSPLGIIVSACATNDNDGMLYSDDGGLTFLEATITGDYDATAFGISLAPVWCGDQWVTTFVDGDGCGFLTSPDGETWATIRPGGAFGALENAPDSLAWNDASGWLYIGTEAGAFLTADFTTVQKVDDVGGDISTAVFPTAAWIGNVVVQVNEVFSASANPIQYALASENDNTVIGGLDYLEGMAVSVVNDGIVLASPNNPAYDPVVVTGGQIELEGEVTGTVTIGLPYTTDIQTLDLDMPQSTTKPGKFLVTAVGTWTEETMSFFAGPEEPTTDDGLTLPAGGSMQPFQVLDRDQNAVTTPQTGFRTVNFEGRWNESGSIFLRNVDPSPLTVLALVPYGTYPR